MSKGQVAEEVVKDQSLTIEMGMIHHPSTLLQTRGMVGNNIFISII
jgi:hypothetical protein